MNDERRRAEELVGRFSEIFGEALVAAVLYGSAARGEYRAGISDLNILIVLANLELTELRRAAEPTREWVAAGNPPPLVMSETEWWSSADVFPLEYSEIRDAHVLLAGRDPFAQLSIRREHLRLQMEHELRSKKIQLREGYLVAGNAPDELGALLIQAFPTFLTFFRGILRLDSRPVPRDAADLVDAAASHVGFRGGPLLEVLKARRGGTPLEASFDGPVAAGYLEAVERTVTWLDRYESPAGVEEI
jgi:hypothetical protein